MHCGLFVISTTVFASSNVHYTNNGWEIKNHERSFTLDIARDHFIKLKKSVGINKNKIKIIIQKNIKIYFHKILKIIN